MTKKNKEKTYKTLWLFTGALLGLLVSALLELLYLRVGGVFTLWLLVGHLLFIILGVLFGRWAGPVAWKKIYIDGVRGKKYLK
jgi:hypothetical protein